MLGWTIGTIELIESGRRRLTTGEAWLLPSVLTQVLPHPRCERPLPCDLHKTAAPHTRAFEVQDLVPGHDVVVVQLAVTPRCRVYSLGWHALVKNQGRFPEEDRAQFETSQDRLLLHYDEVTIRAAKTLRASLSLVAETAEHLWGRSFLIERDARLQAAGAVTGSVQARRGHIARALLDELRQALRARKTTRSQKRRT